MLEDVLDLALGETAFEDQSTGTVHVALGTELRVEVKDDVSRIAAHAFGDVGDVCERGLFGALARDLGRDDGVLGLRA